MYRRGESSRALGGAEGRGCRAYGRPLSSCFCSTRRDGLIICSTLGDASSANITRGKLRGGGGGAAEREREREVTLLPNLPRLSEFVLSFPAAPANAAAATAQALIRTTEHCPRGWELFAG